MKKIVLIIVAGVSLSFSSCTISDQENTNTEIDASMIDPKNPPVMTFEEPIFDFGQTAIGSTVEHTFKFTNTGKGALIIHDVKTSCGCTALKNWPKGAIPPGGTGEIPVEFKPSISGTTSKTISIVANTKPSVQKLAIKGEVIGG